MKPWFNQSARRAAIELSTISAVSVVLILLTSAGRVRAETVKPNVILILIDDQGYYDLNE